MTSPPRAGSNGRPTISQPTASLFLRHCLVISPPPCPPRLIGRKHGFLLGALGRFLLALALGRQTLSLLTPFGALGVLCLPPIGITAHAQPLGVSGRRLVHGRRHMIGLRRRIDEPLAVLEVGELEALGDQWLARREAIEIAGGKLDPIKATALPTRGRAVDAVDFLIDLLNPAEQVDKLGDEYWIGFAQFGREPIAPVPDLFEVDFPRAGVVKRGSMPPSLALRALAQPFARGEIWLHVLDALAADDIDTDCNGVITMANLTVTMTTTRRRRLSQEETEARIEMRVGHLRVLAAQTAVDCVHGAHTLRILEALT